MLVVILICHYEGKYATLSKNICQFFGIITERDFWNRNPKHVNIYNMMERYALDWSRAFDISGFTNKDSGLSLFLRSSVLMQNVADVEIESVPICFDLLDNLFVFV